MTEQSTQDTERQPNTADFVAFLAALDKGRVSSELSGELQKLVAAVENTGRGGTLTLKVAVKPAGGRSNEDGAVFVGAEISLKAPKLTRDASIFFADADHNLVRHNPNQNELF